METPEADGPTVPLSVLQSVLNHQSQNSKPVSVPEHGKPVVIGAVGNGPFHPSPSLDPRSIQAAAGDDWEELKGYLAPAENALSVAFTGLTQIDNARQQAERNPAWNEYQRLLIVAAAAEKKQEQITRAFDTAHKNLTTAADALERSLSEPMAAKELGTVNGEVRSFVKSLSTEKRHKFMADAIQKGDMRVIGSILGLSVPACLSGLSDAEQQHYTRLYRETAAPEAVRRLTATRKAIEMLEQRSGIFLTQVEQAMKGKWLTVQKLRKANSEAEKALLMEADKA